MVLRMRFAARPGTAEPCRHQAASGQQRLTGQVMYIDGSITAGQ